MDDGRHTREIADRQADQPHQPSLGGILVKVDGGEDADRNRKEDGDDAHPEGADDSRPDASFTHPFSRPGCDELPADGAGALGKNVPYDVENNEQHQYHGQAEQRKAELLFKVAHIPFHRITFW